MTQSFAVEMTSVDLYVGTSVHFAVGMVQVESRGEACRDTKALQLIPRRLVVHKA